MIKIVPDPPHPNSLHALEDTLIQAADYVLCALTVAHQSALLLPRTPGSIMMLTIMHELETARALVDTAITQVQRFDEPTKPTLH